MPNKSETNNLNELDQLNAHKQYDRVIALIQYYVQLTWLVFGAFLLSETVLFAAIATVDKDGGKIFVLFAALFGLILTVPWLASFDYNHSLYRLRIAEARSLEPLAGTFFTSGAEIIKGRVVQSPIGEISIPRLSRVLSPSRSARLLIWLYGLYFLGIVILTIRRICAE